MCKAQLSDVGKLIKVQAGMGGETLEVVPWDSSFYDFSEKGSREMGR